MLKNLIQKNVLSTDPTKNIRFIIYYNKFKISYLIILNNTSPPPLNLLTVQTSYICSNVPWETVSSENNTYAGLNTTTLSRRLTIHLNDSSSIALHLKTSSIPRSKLCNIFVENTTIIVHEIN